MEKIPDKRLLDWQSFCSTRDRDGLRCALQPASDPAEQCTPKTSIQMKIIGRDSAAQPNCNILHIRSLREEFPPGRSLAIWRPRWRTNEQRLLGCRIPFGLR
jgi:hypothetical protein